MQKIAASVGGGVSQLLDKMNPGSWTKEIFSFDNGEIGILTHPDVARSGLKSIHGLRRLPNGDAIVWSGLPLPLHRVTAIRTAREVAQAAATLDGVFAALCWSAEEHRLLVVTDFMGLQPLYYGERNGALMFATETKAFDYDPDPAGWGAFIVCGHPIGAGSLTRHAQRLRPATIMTATTDPDISPTQHQYWQWPTADMPPSIEEILHPLERNIADYALVVGDSTCLLSGGFDSRLIGALLAKNGIAARGVIVRHRDENGDIDGILAERIASKLAIPATVHCPERDFFSQSAYLDYIQAIDGSTPNLYLFISQIMSHLEEGVAVWEGLIPGHSLTTVRQNEDGSFNLFRPSLLDPTALPWAIFKPSVRKDCIEAFRAEFTRTTNEHPDTPYGIWQWMIAHRMRNRTGVNPTKVYQNKGLPLLAGSSQAFWRSAARISHAARYDNRYKLALFDYAFPELARIPFESGGKLYGSSSAMPSLMTLRLRNAVLNFLERHPRLNALLGRSSQGFLSSRFLESDAIWAEDDDSLDMDAIQAMTERRQGHSGVTRLLFHWRAARWVHEGRLHATLLPNA